MSITRVFKSGNSQAVRIPKEFHLKCDEVEIFQRNHELVIREKPKNLAGAFKLLTHFSKDFFHEDREDTPPQERDFFK